MIGKIKRNLVYRIYKSDFYRKRIIKQYFSTHDTIKLQIGSGTNFHPDWLNTDVSYTSCKAGALFLDAGECFPFQNCSVDFIYSEHLFEHLNTSQAANMLKECFRVLKPAGTIRIATPNIQFLIDLYLHPEKDINKRYIEWSAAGGCRYPVPETPVNVINKFHTAWGHQIIYDCETLSKMIEDSGFVNIRICEISHSSIPELNNIEAHFNFMPYEFYQLETMILEADKK